MLGFVSREGRGYFGVEEKYNSLLAGNPVRVWVPTDPNKAADIPRVPDGTTLVLTIDRELQASVEQILDQAIDKYGAQHGTIVAMDPRGWQHSGPGFFAAHGSEPVLELRRGLPERQRIRPGAEYAVRAGFGLQGADDGRGP